MKVFRSEDQYDLGPSVVALGTFDGLHIGHQALIFRAMDLAREENAACVVCTFDRHPLSLLCPERAPAPLMTLQEKLDKLQKMGVDGVLVQAFTPEFAAAEPDNYLRTLAEKLQVRGIVAGFNYTFGAKGRGNADLIRARAEALSCRAEIMPAVQDGGETVSSTLIRSLLQRGENARADQLLALQVR